MVRHTGGDKFYALTFHRLFTLFVFGGHTECLITIHLLLARAMKFVSHSLSGTDHSRRNKKIKNNYKYKEKNENIQSRQLFIYTFKLSNELCRDWQMSTFCTPVWFLLLDYCPAVLDSATIDLNSTKWKYWHLIFRNFHKPELTFPLKL